jgi:hypothetical protein
MEKDKVMSIKLKSIGEMARILTKRMEILLQQFGYEREVDMVFQSKMECE